MVDYKVSLTTKLRPPQKGIIAIEPEDYTAAEVAALKQHAKVLAYLSVGSVSDERPYYKELKPYTLRKLDDWPYERYLDLRQPAVRYWLQKRARDLKRRGFDGFWLDNLDVYEEYRSTDMFNAMTLTLHAIKALGGYVMVNGGMIYLTDMMIPHKVQIVAYKEKANAKKISAASKAPPSRWTGSTRYSAAPSPSRPAPISWWGASMWQDSPLPRGSHSSPANPLPIWTESPRRKCSRGSQTIPVKEHLESRRQRSRRDTRHTCGEWSRPACRDSSWNTRPATP